MTGNYELVYHVAENVGIIGILTYPKTGISGFLKIIGIKRLFSNYILFGFDARHWATTIDI